MSKKFTDRDIAKWVGMVVGKEIKVFNKLKDGVSMCEFANKVKPGSVKRVQRGGNVMHKNQNLDAFLKFMTDYGVDPVFSKTDLNSFAKRERVVESFVAFNGKLKEKGFDGPFLDDCKAAKRKAGPVLSLMEQKQQEVANKNVKFDRVKHSIIRNTDEETKLYNTKHEEAD